MLASFRKMFNIRILNNLLIFNSEAVLKFNLDDFNYYGFFILFCFILFLVLILII